MENTFDKRAFELLVAQKELLEFIAKDRPLNEVLNAIARMPEKFIPGCRVALYFVSEGKLVLGAAPAFSNAFTDVVHGCPVGVNRGVCGHVGFTGKRTVSSNVAKDAVWGPFTDWVLSNGIKAAFSTPVLANNGNIVGTVSFYFGSVYEPTAWDFEISEVTANLMFLAVERKKHLDMIAEQSLKLSMHSKLASIGEIASSVASEMNYPLSVIQNHVSFLKLLADKTELSSVAVMSSAGEIEKTVGKVASMVKDLRGVTGPR